jgi:hypothetical protein
VYICSNSTYLLSITSFGIDLGITEYASYLETYKLNIININLSINQTENFREGGGTGIGEA